MNKYNVLYNTTAKVKKDCFWLFILTVFVMVMLRIMNKLVIAYCSYVSCGYAINLY